MARNGCRKATERIQELYRSIYPALVYIGSQSIKLIPVDGGFLAQPIIDMAF